VNPSILAWFAYLHDSQRHDDGRDPLHGHRAADFATRQRRDGAITELSPTEFEQLCEAMRLHSDGHTVSNPAIIACWDADRLDLYRVGIRPLPHRMCTPHARHPATIQAAMRMSEQRRRAKAGR
jgi:uncharacterized protein